MECKVKRDPTDKNDTTFGDWLIDGVKFCDTLEDAVREVPGQPVASWKIHGKTAIPRGRYPLTLEMSSRFGADTITVNRVEGFSLIRVHSGVDKDSTEGCIIVGDSEDRQLSKIGGGLNHHILEKLKAQVKASIENGESAWLTVE